MKAFFNICRQKEDKSRNYIKQDSGWKNILETNWKQQASNLFMIKLFNNFEII